MCDNQNGRYFHSVTLGAFSPHNSLVGINKDQRLGPKIVAGHSTRNGTKHAPIILSCRTTIVLFTLSVHESGRDGTLQLSII